MQILMHSVEGRHRPCVPARCAWGQPGRSENREENGIWSSPVSWALRPICLAASEPVTHYKDEDSILYNLHYKDEDSKCCSKTKGTPSELGVQLSRRVLTLNGWALDSNPAPFPSQKKRHTIFLKVMKVGYCGPPYHLSWLR
jgi:hypothetical protein